MWHWRPHQNLGNQTQLGLKPDGVPFPIMPGGDCLAPGVGHWQPQERQQEPGFEVEAHSEIAHAALQPAALNIL